MRKVKHRRFVVGIFMLASLLVVQGLGERCAHALTAEDYKQLETFAEVLSVAQKNYVTPVPTRELVEGAIEGMVASLDPHSAYLTGERYRDLEEHTSGSFAGIGITAMIKNNILTVEVPMKGTPAERAGIKAGDQVLKINDASTKDMTLDDAVGKMRGPRGTSLTLTLRRSGMPSPFVVAVSRDTIKIPSVDSQRIDGFGYIRLSDFQEASDEEIEKTLAGFQNQGHGKISGLIFDLRDNPGGLLTQAVKISDEFLNGGLVVYTQGRDESQREQFFAHAKTGFNAYPMIILVNGGTASASEIVAGALQDQTRLGGRDSDLRQGLSANHPAHRRSSALQLTTARYYTPGGRSIQAVGITPDVEVTDPRPALALQEEQREDENPAPASTAGSSTASWGKGDADWTKDVQLQKSIEMLKHWNSFKTQLVKKETVIG